MRNNKTTILFALGLSLTSQVFAMQDSNSNISEIFEEILKIEKMMTDACMKAANEVLDNHTIDNEEAAQDLRAAGSKAAHIFVPQFQECCKKLPDNIQKEIFNSFSRTRNEQSSKAAKTLNDALEIVKNFCETQHEILIKIQTEVLAVEKRVID